MWYKFKDKNTGAVFYYNSETLKSTWERPVGYISRKNLHNTPSDVRDGEGALVPYLVATSSQTAETAENVAEHAQVREKAVDNFKCMLREKLANLKSVSWHSAYPLIFTDPRFRDPSLTPDDRRDLIAAFEPAAARDTETPSQSVPVFSDTVGECSATAAPPPLSAVAERKRRERAALAARTMQHDQSMRRGR